MKRELDSLVTQMHSSGIPYEEAVREFKKQYLREVLVAHRGNQCKAAEELGMHRNTLSRTMAELGLELAEVRTGLKRPVRSERPVISTYRQGSALADFLLCRNCGVLIGVWYRSNGRLYATVNAKALDNRTKFAAEQPVSPKKLSDRDKVERWRDHWFPNVSIVKETVVYRQTD